MCQGPSRVILPIDLRRAGGRNRHALQDPALLKGFPASEESLMHAAIPKAESTVTSCKPKRKGVIKAINSKTYKYVDDENAPCGWTFPSSWYIEIGKAAFNHAACCKLESTIAHEASHTQWYTERRARKLECDCFGCSC